MHMKIGVKLFTEKKIVYVKIRQIRFWIHSETKLPCLGSSKRKKNWLPVNQFFFSNFPKPLLESRSVPVHTDHPLFVSLPQWSDRAHLRQTKAINNVNSSIEMNTNATDDGK